MRKTPRRRIALRAAATMRSAAAVATAPGSRSTTTRRVTDLAPAGGGEEDGGGPHRGLVGRIMPIRDQVSGKAFGFRGALHAHLTQQGGHAVGVGGDRRLFAGALDDELGRPGLNSCPP